MRNKRSRLRDHGARWLRQEQLEPRILLALTWQGDFDGDGLLEAAVYGQDPQNPSDKDWYLVEWDSPTLRRETLMYEGGPGETFDWTESFVADFNGDGRSDIVGKQPSGAWQVIPAAASRFTPLNLSSADSPFLNVDTPTRLVGDFDGDGRDDLLVHGNLSGSWTTRVAYVASTPLAWQSVSASSSAEIPLYAGDFNADGLDDYIYTFPPSPSEAPAYHVRYSFGKGFTAGQLMGDRFTQQALVGDFDGDGSDELVGWSNTGQRQYKIWNYTGGTWQLTDWGTDASQSPTYQVGDVNGDGRDDLYGWYGPSSNPSLELLVSLTTGLVANRDPKIQSLDTELQWYGSSTLDLRIFDPGFVRHKTAQVFSDVYNQVELQFYPGYMKGVVATAATSAGNPWDQAALLHSRLNGAGITSRIVKGRVAAPLSEMVNWTGATSVNPTAGVLQVLNQLLVPGSSPATSPAAGTVEFDHVWVQVEWLADTTSTIVWHNLDPSFKARDLQLGINVPAFDGDAYLRAQASDGSLPLQYLPLEYQENRISTSIGQSLAEVPRHGPIRQRAFQGFRDMWIHPTPTVIVPVSLDSYNHRVQLELLDGTVPLWDYHLVSSSDGLNSVIIDRQELWINNTRVRTGPASAVDRRLLVRQFAIGSSTEVISAQSYVLPTGTVAAFGMNALQHSRGSLATNLSTLNTDTAILHGSNPADLTAVTRSTVRYTVDKYWHDFSEDLETIAGLTRNFPLFLGVSTGIATAQQQLYQDFKWDLTFPAVLKNLSVDLKNLYFSLAPIDGSSILDPSRKPALTLALHHASAMEHAIVEEMTNSDGVSAVKGLQLAADAYRVTWNGSPSPIRYTVTAVKGSVTTGTDMTLDQVLAISWPPVPLPNGHPGAIRDRLAAALTPSANSVAITAVIPKIRTDMELWDGSVYILEHSQDISGVLDISFQYAIDGGFGEQLGGYVASPPKEPPAVPPANKANLRFEGGDPVNLANGSVTLDETDIDIPNLGYPLRFRRHYNSQNKPENAMPPSELGLGWSHSYSDRVRQTAEGNIIWTTDEGTEHQFNRIGTSSNFVVPETLNSLSGTFTFHSGNYKYTDKYGFSHQFHGATGKLISKLDRYGNGVTVTFDENLRIGRVADVRDPNRYLQFDHSTPNQMIISDSSGDVARRWVYQLTNGRLTQVTKPAISASQPTVSQYSYYPAGRFAGLLQSVTDPNGRTHAYEYYANLWAFRVTDTSPDASVTTQVFHFNNHRRETEFVDERGNPTLYKFTTTDPEGLLLRETAADRSRTQYTWGTTAEEKYLRKTMTDPMNGRTTYTYHATANNPANDGNRGNIATQTNPDSTSVTYAYAQYSQIKTETVRGGALEVTTTHDYDAAGNRIRTQDAMGNVTTMAYDALGRLNSRTEPNEHANPVVDDTTSYTYDSAGRLLREVRSHANMFYDGFDGPTLSSAQWSQLHDSPGPALGIVGGTLRFIEPSSTASNVILVRKGVISAESFRIKSDVLLSGPVLSAGQAVVISLMAGFRDVWADDFFLFQFRVYRGPNGDLIDGYFTDNESQRLSDIVRLENRIGRNVPATIAMEVIRGSFVVYVDGTQVASYTPPAGVFPGSPGLHMYRSEPGLNNQVSVDNFQIAELAVIRNDYDGQGIYPGPVAVTNAGGYTTFFQRNADNGIAAVSAPHRELVLDNFSSGDLNTTDWPGRIGGTVAPSWGRLFLTAGDAADLVRKETILPVIDGVANSYRVEANLQFNGEGTAQRTVLAGLILGQSPSNSVIEAPYVLEVRELTGSTSQVQLGWSGRPGTALRALPASKQIDVAVEAVANLLKVFLNGEEISSLRIVNAPNATPPGGRPGLRLRRSDGSPNAVSVDRYRVSETYTQENLYNTSGDLIVTIDNPNVRRVIQHVYDGKRRLVESIQADGTSERFAYDGVGNRVAAINPQQETTGTLYDVRHRPIMILHADGQRETIRYDGLGRTVARIDARHNLETFAYDSMGRLLSHTDRDDKTSLYRYDNLGRQTLVRDRRGFVTLYSYDVLGRLTEMRHPQNTWSNVTAPYVAGDDYFTATSYAYDSNGNRVLEIQYDILHPAAHPVPANLTSLPESLKRSFSFRHDAQGRIIEAYDPYTTTIAPMLEHQGTPLRTIYDLRGNVSAVIDRRGGVNESSYDAAGRLVRELSPDPSVPGAAVARTLSVHTYDRAGNRTSSRSGFQPDVESAGPLSRTNHYTYDVLDRPIVMSNAEQEQTQTGYDAAGRIVVSIDPTGSATRTRYDLRGRVRQTISADPDLATWGPLPAPFTTFTYDANGNLTASIDQAGRTTSYTYNRVDRRTSASLPDPDLPSSGLPQPRTTFAYDAEGNLTSQTRDISGVVHVNVFTYDGRGRRLSEKLQASLLASAPITSLDYAYDSFGNRASRTDLRGTVTRYEYDHLHRQAAEIQNSTISGADRTEYRYDASGNLRFVIDARGGITEHHYDRLDRVYHSVLPGPRNVPEPCLNDQTYFFHDAFGNVIREETYAAPAGGTCQASQASNLATHFQFDKANRPIGTWHTVNGQTVANNGEQINDYDDSGQLISVTDAVGMTTHFAYDRLHRRVRQWRSISPTTSERWTYDGLGRVDTYTDEDNRSRQYTYDNLDRVKEVRVGQPGTPTVLRGVYTYDNAGRLATWTDPSLIVEGNTNPANTVQYSYTYDVFDRPTQHRIRLPKLDGSASTQTVEFNYTYVTGTPTVPETMTRTERFNNSSSSSVGTEYRYDRLGRVDQIRQSGVGTQYKRVTLEYNHLDQPTRTIAYSNIGGADHADVMTNYAYDGSHRVSALAHCAIGGVPAPLTGYGAVYDTLSRVTMVTAATTSTNCSSPSPVGTARQIAYDNLHQVTQVTQGSNTLETWNYDRHGNPLFGGTTPVPGDRVPSIPLQGSSPQFHFAYDAQGHRITQHSDSIVRAYEWDGLDHLTRVQRFDVTQGGFQGTVEYWYDLYDRRIAKIERNASNALVAKEYFVYDETGNLALTLQRTGGSVQHATHNATRRYLMGAAVDQVFAEETLTSAGAVSSVHWPLVDHLGSVRNRANYKLTSSTTISAQGAVEYDAFGERTSGPMNSAFGYAGREWDAAIELYNNRARWYDPYLGRFISRDPSGLEGGDTNLYRYVGNSPFTHTDPTGLVREPVSGARPTFSADPLPDSRSAQFRLTRDSGAVNARADIRPTIYSDDIHNIRAETKSLLSVSANPKALLDSTWNSPLHTHSTSPFHTENGRSFLPLEFTDPVKLSRNFASFAKERLSREFVQALKMGPPPEEHVNTFYPAEPDSLYMAAWIASRLIPAIINANPGTLRTLTPSATPNAIPRTVAPRGVATMAEGSPSWAGNLVRHYANRVKPVDGFTDVFIHGTRDGKAFSVIHKGKEAVLNQRQIATWLKSQGVSGDIRLISCYSGSCPTGSVGQNLANKLGVKVRAPTDLITVHPDGTLTAPIGTKWRDLIPGDR